MHKITVAILTCDRLSLTKKTTDSFISHNGRDNFDVYYGDDASSSDEIHEFMKKRDIPCLVRHDRRLGCSPTTEELINKAMECSNNEYIMYLQNDFETVRPIDIDLVERIFEDREVGWIRLAGIYWNNTEKESRAYSTVHGRLPDKPEVEWGPYDIGEEALEITTAPWSHHPSIARRSVLQKIVKNIKREVDAVQNAYKTNLKAVRFLDNITNHIGTKQSTPCGKFGNRRRIRPIEKCVKRVLSAIGLRKVA